jgi:hypothetical protein
MPEDSQWTAMGQGVWLRRDACVARVASTVVGLAVAAGVACGGSFDTESGPVADAASRADSQAMPGEADSMAKLGEADSPAMPGDAGDEGGSVVQDAADALEESRAQPSADATPAADACGALAVTQAYATVVRSAGYDGSDAAYYALFGVPCSTPSDCEPSCTSAGGSASSCSAGSLCLAGEQADGGFGCLPPTYWLDPGGAASRSGMTQSAARDTLAPDNGYDDPLVATGFGLAIPGTATVQGIAFDVSRSADDDNAEDSSVRVVEAGMPVGAERATSTAWPMTFSAATYGGPNDTWGVSWTAAVVDADTFGLSIAPRQRMVTGGAGNVYVDSVRVTVTYQPKCD